MPVYWTLNSAPEIFDCPKIARAYRDIVPYIEQFLTSKHPHRDGDVCPFIRNAISDDVLLFSSFNIGAKRNEVVADIKRTIGHFVDWKSSNRTLGACVIFFAETKREAWIKSIHNELIGYAVDRNLILGNCHPNSPSHSFHSRDWFPLRTPHPLFIVRDMVANDREHLREIKERKWFWFLR